MQKSSMGLLFFSLGLMIMIQTTVNGPLKDLLLSTPLVPETEGSDLPQNVTSNTVVNSEYAQEEAKFAVGMFFAFTLKLISSIDDVVWLVPFLIVEDLAMRNRNIVVYCSICLFQTIFAMLLATGGIAAIDAVKSDDSWSSEKLLSMFAGVCLLTYGFKLLYEWYYEIDDDDDEDEKNNDDEEKGKSNQRLDYNESSNLNRDGSVKYGELSQQDQSTSNKNDNKEYEDDDHDEVDEFPKEPPMLRATSSSLGSPPPSIQHKTFKRSRSHSTHKEVTPEPHQRETHTTSALFIVAFLGSLDDLTLFVPMLVGQAIPWGALVVGAMLAVAVILMVCIFLGMCKPIARVLVAIPLFSIVLCFGTFLTIKALTTD
jgi:hypothetical protein